MLEQIRAWASKGLTYEEIAGNVGIDVKTLRAYRAKYQPLREALSFGMGRATAEVENALWKNAVGYEYEEDAIVRTGNEAGFVIVRVKKWRHADVKAQALWLTNRARADWKTAPQEETPEKDTEVRVSFGEAGDDVWNK